MHELQFFNPQGRLGLKKNRLPHWQQDGAAYFVTFRLGDSLPENLLHAWVSERARWLRANPPPHSSEKEKEYHEQFTATMERWLDTGHGDCVLREGMPAKIVADTLLFFEGERTRMSAFVVMPNHVHALFSLLGAGKIEDVMASWKRHASRQIGLCVAGCGRMWAGWQRDYFDRLVRDWEHFGRCVRYIRRNPEKAKLGAGEFILWESDWVKKMFTHDGEGGGL